MSLTAGLLPLAFLLATGILACESGNSTDLTNDAMADAVDDAAFDVAIDVGESLDAIDSATLPETDEPDVNDAVAVDAVDDAVDDAISDPGTPPVRYYEDKAFPQGIPTRYDTSSGLPDMPITSIGASNDAVWAGTDIGLYQLTNGTWEYVGLASGEPSPIVGIVGDEDGPWVLDAGALHYVPSDGEIATFDSLSYQKIISPALPNGAWVVANDTLCLASVNEGTPDIVCMTEVVLPVGTVLAVAGAHATPFVATTSGLYRQIAGEFEAIITGQDELDWEYAVKGLAVDNDGDLFMADAQGLWRLAEGATDPTLFTGNDGLPFTDLSDVLSDPDGGLLIPSPRGLMLYDAPNFDIYHGGSWLLSDVVNDACRASDGSLWVATDGGVSRIEYRQTTLEEKALRYGDECYERHNRLGYISPVSLTVAGDVTSAKTHDDDNDGQWTGMWLAALSYQYAVTKDETIRLRAVEASRALRVLQDVSYDEGFLARSIIPPEECPSRQGGDAQWQLNDEDTWCWKSDTSTDEYLGHVYGQMVYYDLVADESEKAEIAAMMARLHTHIVGGDYQYAMKDTDGFPTTDGHFDPGFIETTGQFGDAGLNSAKILGGLLVTYYMTGDSQWLDHYEFLIQEHGYDEYVRSEKQIQDVFWINHDGDEMAFMAFHTLMWTGLDPDRHPIWMEGFRYLWETQRPEKNPEFNFTWAASAPEDAEIDLTESVETLKDIHWDLVKWHCSNEGRADMTLDPEPDRFDRPQTTTVARYHQRHVMKWNSNPYGVASNDGGHEEEAATYWILPYWMGRYDGFISAPVPR